MPLGDVYEFAGAFKDPEHRKQFNRLVEWGKSVQEWSVDVIADPDDLPPFAAVTLYIGECLDLPEDLYQDRLMKLNRREVELYVRVKKGAKS